MTSDHDEDLALFLDRERATAYYNRYEKEDEAVSYNVKIDTKLTDVVVDVAELGRPSVYDLIGDMWAIDKIATLLGTSDDWSGADMLETISEIVGIVRPHPAGDGNAYATTFHRATNRDVFPDFDQRR